MRLYNLFAFLLLLFHHLGLLLLHLFHFQLPFGLLHRFPHVLLHLGAKFVLINGHAEDEHLQEGDEVEQQVVIGQCGCEIVEHEEEHDRHHVHHDVHHPLLVLIALRRAHQLVVQPGIDNRGDGHENGEQAHVVAIKRHIETEIPDGVIG